MKNKKVKKKKRRPLELEYISIDEIDVSLSNVRKSNLKEGIEDLAKSIKEIGIQQPVVVFEKSDGRYELIIGQRRYLASKMLEKTSIPCLIANVKSKTDAVIRSFSENIHRLELNYRDKMRAATELLSKYDDTKKVAESLGVSVQTVRKYLGYVAVPKPIKKMVDDGKFGATTALKITQVISDDNRAVEVAKYLAELPRSEDRLYYIDVASEREDKSPREALKIAKRRSEMKVIRIHITKRVYNAILEASKRYDLEMENIVTEAVEEWLTSKGFMNEKVR